MNSSPSNATSPGSQAGKGPEGRSSYRGHRRMLLAGLLPTTYSTCFLIQPRITCPEVVLLSVAWLFPHLLLIKKMPYRQVIMGLTYKNSSTLHIWTFLFAVSYHFYSVAPQALGKRVWGAGPTCSIDENHSHQSVHSTREKSIVTFVDLVTSARVSVCWVQGHGWEWIRSKVNWTAQCTETAFSGTLKRANCSTLKDKKVVVFLSLNYEM